MKVEKSLIIKKTQGNKLYKLTYLVPLPCVSFSDITSSIFRYGNDII